ncbi:MAG: hypothetical protein HFI64_02925 [Lachnospiraceae bacterium]|nr:hypothetical protein [Lachnospiraceae bacterium]
MKFDIKKQKIKRLLKEIDKRTLFISAFAALVVLFYVNPLGHVALTKWNRTFSTAAIAGISIDKRIRNFYLLFLCFMPFFFAVSVGFHALFFHFRNGYKKICLRLDIILLFSVAAAYISRYASYPAGDFSRILVKTIFCFQVTLFLIALTDAGQLFSFADITGFLIGYVTLVLTSNILLRIPMNGSLLIAGILFVCYAALICRTSLGTKIFKSAQNFLSLLMWLPAVLRLVLEGIYFLTEKGRHVHDYYTIVCLSSLIFVILAVSIVLFFRKKDYSFSVFGYVGAITGFSVLALFSSAYQYVCSYPSYAHFYEAANSSVLTDSLLQGKLPVIDYFSAHALGDVWTRLVYCILHSDIKGIFVDPYWGLAVLAGLLALFYVLKNLFGAETAVLFVCFYPFLCDTAKVTSVCLISIAALLYITKKKTFRAYLWFWFLILISAFTTYDEGISLGIACIIAYLIFIFREKTNLKRFILGGATVGGLALLSYVLYALATGVPVISRLREWISVSVGSNSSWATADFGNITSFTFLFSYFLIPITAVAISGTIIFQFVRKKEASRLAAVTLAFALVELLYFTRGVLYHNLTVCDVQTGVLFNYVHWAISLFALYLFTQKKKSFEKGLFVWLGAFGLMLLAEGAWVTGGIPQGSSVVYAHAANASQNWNLHNNTTENCGQERILYDETFTAFADPFNKLFDTLLTKDQTFLDFANVTSLYALTGKVRPCYVGQSPSLLTDLYSQERFFSEIAEHDCPLAVLGTTEDPFTQQMLNIPHNIRYYKIAEYIYKNYRPLVKTGDFVIWCKRELHSGFTERLEGLAANDAGYELVDYGYDDAEKTLDENGTVQFSYRLYHSFSLEMLPYIWANYDNYDAVENEVLMTPAPSGENSYAFPGSQSVINPEGNYVKFDCFNPLDSAIQVTVIFRDGARESIRYEYRFTVLPGSNTYLIRASQDYFWEAFNIDTMEFNSENGFQVTNLNILKGD